MRILVMADLGMKLLKYFTNSRFLRTNPEQYGQSIIGNSYAGSGGQTTMTTAVFDDNVSAKPIGWGLTPESESTPTTLAIGNICLTASSLTKLLEATLISGLLIGVE